MSNAPHSAEHIILLDDEKKATYVPDTKIVNSGTFTLMKEDHTLGNMIRLTCLRDERCTFAGYRMPHPLEYVVNIKVRSREGSSPQTIFKDSLHNLTEEFTSLEESFKSAVMAKRNPENSFNGFGEGY